MTDSVCDLIVRLKTGHMAHKNTITMASTKFRLAILDVLQREGYIRSYATRSLRSGVNEVDVELKYYEGKPVIQRIRAKSTPGRRTYVGAQDIKPVHNGLGTAVISTPKGVLADSEARAQNVGGELLFEIF